MGDINERIAAAGRLTAEEVAALECLNPEASGLFARARALWRRLLRKPLNPSVPPEVVARRERALSDYLNADDKPERRDLPAERIAAFESVMGNSLISQWIALRQELTCLEQMQADAKASA